MDITLRSIASECPEIAGYTRERAMDLLPTGDIAIARPDIPNTPGCQGLYGNEEDRGVDILESHFNVQLSPNPVADVLLIDFNTPFSGSIEIFDLLGQQTGLLQKVNSQTEASFSVNSLSKGLYLLSINSNLGEHKIFKFIVSK